MPMNDADQTELHRLCDHLRTIDERSGLSAEQRDALKKAGFALHRAFMEGWREENHAMIDQPLLESERAHLRSLGINPLT